MVQLTPDDDTWSIVFVPYTNGGAGGNISLQSNGVITMKSNQLLNFMYGSVANGEITKDAGVTQANADLNKAAAAVANDTTILNYAAADAGAAAMAALTGVQRPADAAAAAGAVNTAFAIQVPPIMTELYGNGYLSRFFSAIPPASQKNITQCFFRAIERRVAIVAADADLPAVAVGGGTATALRASFNNNIDNFAYLLLLRYQGGAGIPPANYAKHSEVYYKKYMQSSRIAPGNAEPAAAYAADTSSFLTSLFNVFSLINPAVPPGRFRGGSGHSSILAQYMPQLGRKQSKKHRRKYAKGRTARR